MGWARVMDLTFDRSPNGQAHIIWSRSLPLKGIRNSYNLPVHGVIVFDAGVGFLFFLFPHLSSREMAAFAQEQLDALVTSMYREGFLDEQFQQIRALDDGGSPDFLVEVIGLYCADAERILNELNDSLNQPSVDYKKVDAYVHQMKGSSASVGAHSVKLACMLVRESCDKNDKEGCLQALNLANQRFYELSKRLNIMLQLEQTVYAYKAGK